jgi:hypothetical protein
MRSEKLRRLITVLEEAQGIMSDFPDVRLFDTWRRGIGGLLCALYAVVETKEEEKEVLQK